jgi:hypothetical protein
MSSIFCGQRCPDLAALTGRAVENGPPEINAIAAIGKPSTLRHRYAKGRLN